MGEDKSKLSWFEDDFELPPPQKDSLVVVNKQDDPSALFTKTHPKETVSTCNDDDLTWDSQAAIPSSLNIWPLVDIPVAKDEKVSQPKKNTISVLESSSTSITVECKPGTTPMNPAFSNRQETQLPSNKGNWSFDSEPLTSSSSNNIRPSPIPQPFTSSRSTNVHVYADHKPMAASSNNPKNHNPQPFSDKHSYGQSTGSEPRRSLGGLNSNFNSLSALYGSVEETTLTSPPKSSHVILSSILCISCIRGNLYSPTQSNSFDFNDRRMV